MSSGKTEYNLNVYYVFELTMAAPWKQCISDSQRVIGDTCKKKALNDN